MRRLPDRPDLDQLRRQAKELLQGARRGDPNARRRMQAVSPVVQLATAELAVAREYGFASWPRLRQEVERRREAKLAARPVSSTPMVRSWESMGDWMRQLLQKRTGQDVEAWNKRIAGRRFSDENALREWLKKEGVTGYSQQLLVWERFGYPGFMTSGAEDLISRQYADRPQLRPILDAILARLPEVNPVITVQARKTYISLVNERRTFAVVQATTRNRVDLGLRLEKQRPTGRLRRATGVGNGSMSVKLELQSVGDLDGDAIQWLKRAYHENQAVS
jgi:hypothetical protein